MIDFYLETVSKSANIPWANFLIIQRLKQKSVLLVGSGENSFVQSCFLKNREVFRFSI